MLEYLQVEDLIVLVQESAKLPYLTGITHGYLTLNSALLFEEYKCYIKFLPKNKILISYTLKNKLNAIQPSQINFVILVDINYSSKHRIIQVQISRGIWYWVIFFRVFLIILGVFWISFWEWVIFISFESYSMSFPCQRKRRNHLSSTKTW